MNEHDTFFMQEALNEATFAKESGDVPVGAVLVHGGNIISRGRNNRFSANNPLGHAEIIAIYEASKIYHDWRLTDSTIYVTLEPCLMCIGAIINARISRLVFGTSDERFGALSLYKIDSNNLTNHKFEVKKGVLEKDCSTLLQNFFLSLRKSKIKKGDLND